MSAYKFCKTCKGFHYTDKECLPIYVVFHPDYLDEDGREVRGHNHYDAALKYAQQYNSETDGELMDEYGTEGEGVKVTVVRNDVKKVFRLSAEHSIEYNIDEIEGSDADPKTK